MKERPPKNRHHYVPKFYLRNFGNSEQAISTFACTTEKYIKNASIRNMCQHENLYGKTDELEDFLMNSEGIFAQIIKTTINNNQIPKDCAGDYLYFILQSNARTLKQAKLLDYKTSISTQIYLSMSTEFKEKFPEYDYKQIETKYEVPNHIPLSHTNDLFDIASDLEYCLLVNKSNAREFITSDQPVTIDNYLAKKLGCLSGYGFANSGVLIYFPISPKHCILFFDSEVYDIPYDAEKNLNIYRASEIDKLNRYIYLNSFSNIFFTKNIKESYIIKKIQKNSKRKKMTERELLEQSIIQLDSKENEKLIIMRGDFPHEQLSLNFIKINAFGEKFIPTNRGTFYIRRAANKIINEQNKLKEKGEK